MSTLRVLLADSDSFFRNSAQRALTRQGYFVIPAATGVDALTHLESDEIDLIVSEVALPQRDGLAILRAAKAKSAELPVILLTEARNISIAAAGVREGAFDYLLKPLDDFIRLAVLIDRAAGRPLPPEASPVSEILRVDNSSVTTDAPRRFLDAAMLGQELNQLLALFAAELAQLVHAAHTVVLLAHDDGQFHIAASHGYVDRAEAARTYVQTLGDDFAWQVAAAREVVWQSVDTVDRAGTRQEAQPVLALPLVYAHHVLGVAIAFATASEESLSPATLGLIHHFAQEAALSIELARAHSRVQRLTPSDPVTQQLTRAHFFERADREFRRSWRFGQSLAALQLDVDDFGKLHLELGPNGGDEVMAQVARVARPRLRYIDLVGRLDVDSLGILLVMATRENALVVAERLRRTIAELEVTMPDGPWQVTASIGVASYPRDKCASVHDLFALAEQATRAAKRAGRNRVIAV